MKVRSLLPAAWGERGKDVEPFQALQGEIDRLFGEFTSAMPAFGNWPASTRLAVKVDIAETEKAFEVTAELPGVNEKDIDVSLAGDMLTIRAEKKSDHEEKKKDYHLVERSFGSFKRRMQLPFDADAAKIDAKFEKGVLKLVVQKPAEAMIKTQKIEVKAAA